MFSTLFKYNIILIVLCIGMTLIHISSQALTGESSNSSDVGLDDSTKVSPQCRSVMLTIKALGKNLNEIPIQFIKDEKTKINFQQTLPKFESGEFVSYDIHSILIHLVQTYGGDDNSLYPNNTDAQESIREVLNFDKNELFPPFIHQYNRWIFFNEEKPNQNDENIYKQLEEFNTILNDHNWAAGKAVTLADIALVATISTFEVAGVDLTKYNKINVWLKNCKDTLKEYNNANQEGIDIIQSYVSKRNK